MAIPINIEDLLDKRKIESNRIEFKKGWNPDKIYRTINAFANDFDNIGGGYILVGIEEENGIAKRPVCGVSPLELDGIQKSMVGFNSKIEPYYLPRTSIEEVDGKCVFVIWVPSGVNRPYSVMENVTAKHSQPKWYVRNGSSSIEAKGDILEELREMACRVPFDDRGNMEIKLNDLSPLLVQDYLRRVNSRLKVSIDSFSSILDYMNLYTGSTENRLLKNVAVMMFCETPEKYFPYMQVDVVIFPEGKIKNPNKFSEATFKGPVHQLIWKVLEHLKAVVIREYVKKKKDQPESERYFNYPYQALEEAVVNALYHRNYQEREPVEITVEPDRLTILSYSGPDRSISDESLREGRLIRSRRYRNRRLGDFLKELGLSEGRSTGIPTIQEELRKNGSAPAVFETDNDRTYFLVDIPCHPDAIVENLEQEDAADILPTYHQLVSNLSPTCQLLVSKYTVHVKCLIKRLKETECASAEELHIAVNLSPRSRQLFTKQYLLTMMEDGLIEQTHPDTPRHPRQKYRLTDKGRLIDKVLEH